MSQPVKKYRGEHGDVDTLEEADISLCSKFRGCYCSTYSILSDDKTHYTCGKCGNTK